MTPLFQQHPALASALNTVLQVHEGSVLLASQGLAQPQPGVWMEHLTFHAPGVLQEAVPAFLVRPEHLPQTQACVIFLHPATGRKEQFLAEAMAAARAGYVALAFDLPLARPGSRFAKRPNVLQEPQFQVELFSTILCEAAAALASVQHRVVNPQLRAVVVGQNLGAALGAVWAAHDARVAAMAFVAGLPSMSRFWTTAPHPLAKAARQGASPEQLAAFLHATAPFDAEHHVGTRTDLQWLLQFGLHDDWIPESEWKEFCTKVKGARVLTQPLPDDHDMQKPQAATSRLNWLNSLVL